MTSTTESTIYKLIFSVPVSHFAAVKAAVHTSGAGNFPGYTGVSFQTQGMSVFLPSGATEPNEMAETKVEVFCSGRVQAVAAVAAMKKSHPYKVVSYAVFKAENI
ncbi:hypothetical protein VE00_10360 [Pseudogymnoascus sp. WSF 3629]|nr:hypothetical protein VE00_10360 [Pseudogymnoascus sp. WSF 3629]